ncbi:alpha/beta fold hydrolase [Mangrovihabitans endophyticus]|uniref:Alpha/beta hydrolase n=1 Tax=Mangrovihabitans endophyticus TaxID=1751298 RepID=A0A8J3BWB4_9ACTN|nr:alpha/beta hydrolase [Mangrovihabitans endophyticus]GGK83902.1 alpha/beta hydrolase [Mangrovihabitans endophyticus]
MNTAEVNGIRLHVEELPPQGPARGTAVLLHGMAGDSLASWYLTLAPSLAAAGMRVLMHDLRGHGRSDRPPRGYALGHFVDDVAALLDRHWSVDEPVHLLGNSFGGTIAFGYAARRPERVAGIVAIESAPPVPAWFDRIERRLAQAAAFPGGGGRRVRDTLALLRDTPIRAELHASALPTPDDLAGITCPVLCLFGGESAVRQLAPQTEALMPQTRTVVIDGGRHSLLLEHRAQVRDQILPWLRDTRKSFAEGTSHG